MRPEVHEDLYHSRVDDLVDQLKKYLNNRYELLKLKAVDKVSTALSIAVSNAVLIFFAAWILVLLSIGTSLWIGEQMNSTFSGFFIVSGFIFLVGLFVYVGKDKLVKKPVADKFINDMLND